MFYKCCARIAVHFIFKSTDVVRSIILSISHFRRCRRIRIFLSFPWFLRTFRSLSWFLSIVCIARNYFWLLDFVTFTVRWNFSPFVLYCHLNGNHFMVWRWIHFQTQWLSQSIVGYDNCHATNMPSNYCPHITKEHATRY